MMKAQGFAHELTRAVICVVVLIGIVGSVHAGVGACRDNKGRYLGPRWYVDSVKPLGNIWSEFNANNQGVSALNPGGDANGDLWPAVVENTVAPHHPWVVWSRFNGTDYDLAWSRWKGMRWTKIAPVHSGRSKGNDLDADMAFDRKGRPYVVWWRNENGRDRVFFSAFLRSKWMSEIQVSDVAMNGRNPTIEIREDGTVVVEYETPAGLYAQVVNFDLPVTITDDINPFSHVALVGHAVIVRRNNGGGLLRRSR